MQIIIAKDAPKPYRIAAEQCAYLWQAVTGETLSCTDTLSTEDALILGADDQNPCVNQLMGEGLLDSLGIRYGTDDYCIKSLCRGEQKLLILAGGRGRSTLYAVYDFFQRAANCHYYWDGDTLPQGQIDITGYDVTEKPHFSYRGLRYFAHRSLHRFQAEHWGYADWCKEIDWMVKRRLNFLMLRIGHDDIFQKAFPDIVSYPDPNGILPEAGEGYDNRSLFWSLQFRGELRQKVLQYAFDRDLIHSEDCGTMTHWYSRTPIEFLQKVKPDFVPQSTNEYRQPTGLVWDIRKKENLDRYFKLTDAYVTHYGKAELFHTIGLAERMCYPDRRDNLNFKLYTYRQICRHLRETYPNAKLLIAAWDFVMYWTPEEVQKLIAELNPEQCMILDYTSETKNERDYFGNWGLLGQFPWIFGIFHGYESDSQLRGDYAHIHKRLSMAKNDPMCKGMIFWPELSHSDTLMLEYFTQNAWSPNRSLSEALSDLCDGRYGANAANMKDIWEIFLPLLPLSYWSFDREDGIGVLTGRDQFLDICHGYFLLINHPDGSKPGAFVLQYEKACRDALLRFAPHRNAYSKVFAALAALTDEMRENAMLYRDAVDLARSALCRYINDLEMSLELKIRAAIRGEADADDIPYESKRIMLALTLFADLLALLPEYSLNDTLARLKQEAPVNPHFAQTLKDNAFDGYCRSHIYEIIRYAVLPEHLEYFKWLERYLRGEAPEIDFKKVRRRSKERFLYTPLGEMAPKEPKDFAQLMRQITALLQDGGSKA